MSEEKPNIPKKTTRPTDKQPKPRRMTKDDMKNYCDNKLRNGTIALIVIGIVTIASLSLLLVTAIRTRNAVIIVNYDFENNGFVPLQDFVYTTKLYDNQSVEYYRYASTSNMTFKPYMIWIYMVTPQEEILAEERMFSQLTSEKFLPTFNEELQVQLINAEYYAFFSASKRVNANESGSFKLRMSADYKIMLSVTYIGDIDGMQYPDAVMNFVYMQNAGSRSINGRLRGNALIDVKGGEATIITIDDFYCRYNTTQEFFTPIDPEVESEVVPYPYLLNITKTIDFWGYF